jgi:NADH-ubiquinone oxidoreductase chain 4
MISLLLIIPLIGCLLLLPIEEDSIASKNKMKTIALASSLLTLMVSIFMWIEFDANTTEYQFVYEFKQLSFCHLNVGIDGTSLYFVLLTTFLTPLCLLSNWTDITKKIKYFLISFLILETLQIAVFVVLDLLLFYIFFESVLIPLFIVILTWGASMSRIRAAFLLFLYTLFGSLFMLLAIMTIYFFVGSTDFQLISLSEISLESQKWLWLSLSFSKRDMTSRFIHKYKHTLNILDFLYLIEIIYHLILNVKN